MQGNLNYIMLGRKLFDPKMSVDLQQFNISMWQGISSSVRDYQIGCMLNLDICYRVIHSKTVLEEFREMGGDQLKIKASAMGQLVISIYNNRPYKIVDVDFSLTPQSTFETRRNRDNPDVPGDMKDYATYYRERYNKNISDMSQPLLIAKDASSKLKDTCNLIPELCCFIGLTNEMLGNF